MELWYIAPCYSMDKIKVFNYTTNSWDIFEGYFMVDGEFCFDIESDDYIDANGNIKFIAYQYINGTYVKITDAQDSELTESVVSGAFITIDQDGLVANDGTENTAVIDSTGKVTIKGQINATSGLIGNWNISGTTLMSQNASMILDPVNNIITVGNAMPIRYIRDWSNGNTINAYNYWSEIAVVDNNNINVALNKTATCSQTLSGSYGPISTVTDGSISLSTNANYIATGSGIASVTIDLGQAYTNLRYVQVWHYYTDSRIFHETKTEVSTDGITWVSIFDSTVSGEYAETSAGRLSYTPNSINNVTLSTANGIIANKGQIAGWTISGDDLVATNLTLSGGLNPRLTIGSNISITPTLLTISNGAINLTSASGKLTLDSTCLKAQVDSTHYAKLDGSGLSVVGGAISITTGVQSASKMLTMDSTGIVAQYDSNNKVIMDADGVRVIKNGNTLGAAITKDGIIGQLLTDQSIAGSKFDKTAPAQPTITSVTSSVAQMAETQFVNIEVTFNSITDSDRAGYKVYLKESTYSDSAFYFVPMAVIPADSYGTPTAIKYTIRDVKPNTQYTIVVTSFDVTGNECVIDNAHSNTFTTVKDTVAPAPVDSITVISGFKMIGVTWPAVTQNWNQGTQAKTGNCTDLNYYILQRSTDGTNYSQIGIMYGTSAVDKDVDYTTTYTYRVIPVDKSGNSPLNASSQPLYKVSTPVSASQVGNGDIVAKSITTELISIGSLVKSINAKETTLFHFDGTLMSTQGYTPYVEVDGSGNKITHQNGFFRREAKFGGSLSIEEDTTNLISVVTGNNADLKSTSSGWIIDAGATFVASNGVDGIDDGYFNVQYFKGVRTPNITVEPGKTYTISVYAKTTSTGPKIRCDITPKNGDLTKWSNQGGTTNWNSNSLKSVISQYTTNEWTRYSASFYIPELSNTSLIDVYIHNDNAVVDSIAAVDSIQLEQRAYPTSFYNGIKSEGYVDYYAPGLITRDKGVIAFWIKSLIGWHNPTDNDHPDDSPTVDNWFIWGKEIDTNKIMAKYNRQTSTLTVIYGTGTINYVFPSSILDTDWIHFAYCWQNGSQILYINGTPVGTATASSITEPNDILFRLGYLPRKDGSNNVIEEWNPIVQNKRARASAFFDEFRIDKVIRTEDEIKSWFNQDSSFYDAAAQIDADSQNISAANASVVINNEGITVRDGKIAVESEDGKILLKDGRLSVNGLDVGVPQSDNAIQNGTFTILDNDDSTGDCYVYEKGLARYGAKYWNIKRSSAPILDNMLTSVAWNRVSITSYMDPSLIKMQYTDNISPIVKGIASYNPNQYTSYAFDQGLLNPAYATLKTAFDANSALKTACVSAAQTEVTKAVNMQTYNVTNDITATLTGQGISDPNVIAYTVAVAQSVIDDISQFVEYNVVAQIKTNDPSATQNAIDACKTASRNAINSFISSYLADTSTQITTELTTSLTGKTSGVPETTLLIGITVNTVVGFKDFVKMTIESEIDNQVNEKYQALLDFRMGVVTYNGTDGTTINKVYHISDDEKLYEVLVDLNNLDPSTAIDPATGLPVTSPTEFTGGNTSVFVKPFESLYGRIGYAELGVQGSTSQSVELSQPISGLITYTDGVNDRGINFKQHTFSFNAAWKEDDSHNKIKSNSGKLTFEVEELIPTKPLDRNPTTGVVPLVNGQPARKADYDFVNGQFVQSATLSYDVLSPSIMTDDNAFITLNTIGTKQYCALGNVTIDYETLSYVINSVKDYATLGFYQAYGNAPMTGHPMGNGFIKDGVLYIGAATINDVDISKAPAWSVTTTSGHDIMKTQQKGDFILLGIDTYTKCNMSITSLQSPRNGIADVILDGKPINIADNSFVADKMFDTEFKDFTSGIHQFLIVNRCQAGVNTSSTATSPGLEFMSCRFYDWEKLVIDDNTNNKEVFEQSEDGKWNTVYIAPKYANSLNPDGSPILPEMIPIKYKVFARLEKDAVDSNPTSVYVTGIQGELGTNPSYTRLSYGEGAIQGHMIQSYDSAMWLTSGIQSKHFEEYLSWYPGETGIQTRHIADGQILSSKIGDSSVTNAHIAKSNISFEKTRIRKIKLDKMTLTTEDYISSKLDSTTANLLREQYSSYVSTMPTSQQSSILYTPAAIHEESEFVIKNGMILDVDDDYTLTKHLAFVHGKDVFDVAVLYEIIANGTEERTLTQAEVATLIATISNTDLYANPVLASKIKELSVLFCTKVNLLTSTQTINGYVDKYKIQFWEEL